MKIKLCYCYCYYDLKSAHRTVGLIDASEEDELREEDGSHQVLVDAV